MKDKFHFKHTKAFIVICLLIILIGGFAVAQTTHAPTEENAPVPTTVSMTVPTAAPSQSIEARKQTMTGVVVCLPHKDTSGPQTLECAIGLQTDVSEYYALDTNLMSTNPPPYTTGDKITASGIITPIENLSADHWQKYNVKGIFSITEVQKNN